MYVNMLNTLFAPLDAMATIYFITWFCVAFFQERWLAWLLEKRSIDTTELGDPGPCADVEG